ncbi:cytochrome c biogenesis heme-transporting ATPase CcmA [Arhodomonas sp. SL1]|uniref:cytochrome c biogenesis heme-transporting ATPase CcmA n=1 Tax=Arhodomonas sp. SL1 TaxID=3425691 RepID=UPI003F88192C
MVLQASELLISRGERILIDGLDLAVEPGEVLLVAGPNGSGKTTLLRTLAGLSLPEEGVVRWKGTDIRGDGGEFRAALIWVGHQPGIKLELSPRENLRVFSALHGEATMGIDAALARMGLGEHRDVPCRHLSAGQRRRVLLARLLSERAAAWILDEPYTALDRRAIEALEARLAEHAAGGGVTVMTSHQPVLLEGVALRHLELDHG